MKTISIGDLARAPGVDGRRMAKELIAWLAAHDWTIVQLPARLKEPETLPLPFEEVYPDA